MRMIGKAAMFAASASVAAMMAGNAAAQDDMEAALERFRTLMAEHSFPIDWANADISGDTIQLSGVTAGTGDETIPIGDLTLAGIEEAPEGYRIESVSMDAYTFEHEGTRVAVEGVELSGVLLADDDIDSPLAGLFFYEVARLDSAVVSLAGTDVFTISNMVINVSEPDEATPMEFTGTSDAFEINLETVDDQRASAIISQMGYEQLSGSFAMAGSWNPSDGRLTLSQNDITIDQAGTLGISLDLAGYTTEFARSLRELQSQMAENPDGDQSAQGMAMLGLMQQLSLHRAEIFFEDDTLTQRVLEVLASQQGRQPQDIANQAKAVLPFMLAQLNVPDLTMAVTNAVSTFLDNPQSLRVVAEPANPQPFAILAAGAMSSPQALVQQLGVRVTAND